MKNISLSSIFILFSIVFFYGCGKRCAEFNEDILTWMPYQKGDSLILENDGILRTCYFIKSKIIHTDKMGTWDKCDCESSYSINLQSDSLDINLMFNHSYDVSRSYIELNNETFCFEKLESNYTYNNKDYLHVLIFENCREEDENRFDKILISKSIGIIGIIGSSEEWIIYDDSTKQIHISNIDQDIIDC